MTSQRRRRHRVAKDDATDSLWNDPAGVPPAILLLACIVFGGGLLLGGSGGSFGDTIVQLLALPLIVLAAAQWRQRALQGPDRLALVVILGVVVLAFIQLLPLPIGVWSALPGRGELFGEMQAAGAHPAWSSLSLNPSTTESALQWTLPAIAMFLGVRWASSRQRKLLLIILFFGAIALLIFTLTQRGGGAQTDVQATANDALAKANLALSTSYKDPSAGRGSMFTGLFSNRNHFATFLAMTLPLVVAMGIKVWQERKKNEPQSWVPWAGFLSIVVIGLMVGMFKTHSRAALVLGGLSLIGSLALLRHMRFNRMLIWGFVLLAIGGATGTFLMSGSQTVARLDASPSLEMRWQIHATTLQAARHFGPLGSGLGTFVQAYQTVQPEKDFGPQFINRAHGDYHELWLEAGLPGIALVALFFGWFAWSAWTTWRDADETRTSSLLARAATLSIAMVLLHSYIDYPLRKTTILVIFGLACALIAPAGTSDDRRGMRSALRRA